MCSTRRRPDKVQELLKSFDETKSEGTEIILYVWNNDPKIKEYRKVLKDRNVIYGPESYLIEIQNYVCAEAYPDIEYYCDLNDDMVCRTKGWDKRLIKELEEKGNGWGIACGRDLIQKDWYLYQHPSGYIMSGNIVRTLGYLVYPLIKHFYGDVYLKEMSLGIDRLFHVPEVVVEHKCWVEVRKSEEDDNTREIHARESKDFGVAMYLTWENEQKDKDMKKLKDAMRKEGIKI